MPAFVGTVGYGGPTPPKGTPLRYVFKLYALDVMPTLPPAATQADLMNTMTGHILVETELRAPISGDLRERGRPAQGLDGGRDTRAPGRTYLAYRYAQTFTPSSTTSTFAVGSTYASRLPPVGIGSPSGASFAQVVLSGS